jgi:TonB-linked SusC/RagA family outer membrane protein
MKRILLVMMFSTMLGTLVWAQSRQVQGTVVSAEDNQPLPGVNILVQGTTKGAVTDANGSFSIELTGSENTLVFSFIGYKSQTVEVGSQTQVSITLEPDAMALEEIVVVGYGTMQEKDLTSSVVTIKSDEIIKTPTSQAMQALQGKVPGVQIVSSGAPGAGPTVRVRGIGSLPGQGDSDPLYVVDGMFFDNIDFLNTSDIATISVLKDASAASIYGVRAANGVVLITTKSGSYNQKTEVTYNGYYGVQVAQNVLKMANAEQFTEYALATGSPADASFIDNAFQRYGRSRINPNVPDVNTDWYAEVMRPASIQNHTISVSGGKDNVQYSVGMSYFDQDGLLEITPNNYKRLNFRTKVDFRATERLQVGGNVNISNAQQFVAEDAAWFNAYFAVPIMPVFDEQNTNAAPYQLSNAQQLGYRNPQNPFYNLYYNNNRNNVGKILGNFYYDYQLIPSKLSFKMAYNYSYQTVNSRNVDFAYSTGVVDVLNALSRSSSTSLNQILDNTLTYTNDFGAHNITVLGGYSFRSEVTEGTFARAADIPTLDPDREETWFMPPGVSIDRDNSGDFGSREFGASYFGRIAYNYDDRYLLYSTFRRDGTNKFQQKWGNFFTIGGGWVVSEEEFFGVPSIDYLKLRGSWGELGNDGVQASVGQGTVSAISTAIDEALAQGIIIDNTFDFVDRWEKVAETNIGLTAQFLSNRLSLDLDWYTRDTKDAVVILLLPAQRDLIRRNGAEIRNTGIEAALNWSNDLAGGIRYSIGANFTTLKNEVRSLRGQQYLDAGQAEFLQRSIVGESINAFFGYEINGVFQNQSQIDNSGYTSEFITERGLVPGDFFFKDQNGDGRIDAADRVVLGSILPNFMYGFDFSVAYKGFELTANFQGMTGHSILNRKRGEIIFTNDTNIDAELATNLWKGEGTSDRYPSAAGLRKAWNLNMSDHYVEDGSYFRIQNVRLTYNVESRQLFGINLPQTQLVFTAERPVTVFNYNGFNPEVANGIDRQTYPIPAVYTMGLNLKF